MTRPKLPDNTEEEWAAIGRHYFDLHPLHRAAATIEGLALADGQQHSERTIAHLVLHGLGQPYPDAALLVSAALTSAEPKHHPMIRRMADRLRIEVPA